MQASKYVSDATGIPLEDAENNIIELSVLRRILPENYVVSSNLDIEKPIKNQNKIIKEISSESIKSY